MQMTSLVLRLPGVNMDKDNSLQNGTHTQGMEEEDGKTHQGGVDNGGYSHDGEKRRPSTIVIEILKGSKSNLSNLSDASRRPSLAAKLASDQATQRFTDTQKKTLSRYSSVSYQPSHHRMYMDWLAEQLKWSGIDRWILLTLIGLVTGVMGFLLKNCLQTLDRFKWTTTKELAQSKDSLQEAFSWAIGTSVIYVIIGSMLIVFVHPPAAGSGVPETIAFLNGVVVHGTLSLKQLVVKFLGLVFATGSGLPSTTQGPLIAMGAIIGAGIGQFKSKTLDIMPSKFSQFRNAADRRSFTTAGIAAGVAAGFNAPIGGLLYAMEDLSSFWSRRLCWETFFCSGVAAVTANLFNSAFIGFQFQGAFGHFKSTWTVPVQMTIVSLVPAIVLGMIGGLLGAFFTRLNVLWCSLRQTFLSKLSNQFLVKCVRITEPVILVTMMVCIAIYLPLGFPCSTPPSQVNITSQECIISEGFDLNPYRCHHDENNTVIEHPYYNEVATLMQGSANSILLKLTSRGTHRWLSYSTLFAILPLWFLMTCFTAGSAICGGTFVPTLVSGALYGRALGLGLCDLWKLANYDSITQPSDIPLNDVNWSWMDPGVMAVIGAGSLLAGMTRLTLAVTVIVIEMDQDIGLTIPVLTSIFVAKVVADLLCKPLWKYQLDSKALPYLDADPVVAVNGVIINLELFEVRDVMNSPVCTIHSTESVSQLAALLLQNDHGAYPVVQYDQQSRTELMYGIISRNELYVILYNEAVYNEERVGAIITPELSYEEISVDYIEDPRTVLERLRMYGKFPIYQSIFINLDPFINKSAPKVDFHYSLQRGYNLFRTMGLRHLTIVDVNNRVCGIITRKDLMAFNIEEKLVTKAEAELEKLSLSSSTFEIGRSFVKSNPGSIAEEEEEEEEEVETKVQYVEQPLEEVHSTDTGFQSKTNFDISL